MEQFIVCEEYLFDKMEMATGETRRISINARYVASARLRSLTLPDNLNLFKETVQAYSLKMHDGSLRIVAADEAAKAVFG